MREEKEDGIGARMPKKKKKRGPRKGRQRKRVSNVGLR
jgi:hypothetical protein